LKADSDEKIAVDSKLYINDMLTKKLRRILLVHLGLNNLYSCRLVVLV